MDISKATICVVDFGTFTPVAECVARSAKKVYLNNPSAPSPNPIMNQAKIGFGLENIEVVDSLDEHRDKIDAYFFLDVGNGERQIELEEQGFPVWGCRRIEKYEFDRCAQKELMEELKLPVGPYDVVEGMDNLRAYLKVHKNVFIKICHWRGYFETKFSKNYDYIRPFLDNLETKLWPLAGEATFILEQPLEDKIELAIDTWNVVGQIPKIVGYGPEVKNEAYIGMFTSYDSIPDALKKYDKAMSPTLTDEGFVGFYSPEHRVGKDKIGYMIDLCCRVPSPVGEGYTFNIKNLAQVMLDGANGICTDPVIKKKFVAELLITSPWAIKHPQPLVFPKEIAENVKIRNHVKVDGIDYCLPQFNDMEPLEDAIVGAVVANGNTAEEAIEACREAADQVEGDSISIPTDALDRGLEEIDKAKEWGLWPKE